MSWTPSPKPQLLLIRISILCPFLFVCSFLFGQTSNTYTLDPAKAITQYSRDVWQTEQGLPQNSVNSLIQTKEGYLWLGTQEGIVRFDGARFLVFDKKHTGNMRSNYIWSIVEDNDSTLWVGTNGGGLIHIQGTKFTHYSAQDGLPSDIIQTLYMDSKRNLWIGTSNIGLVRMSNGTFTTFSAKEGLTNNSVQSIFEDRQGTLWIGTSGGGLGKLLNGRVTMITANDGLGDNHVLSILQDKDGSLLAGTNAGLMKMRDGKFIPYTTRQGAIRNIVMTMLEDRAGCLWLGTAGAGLMRIKQGAVETFNVKEGLSDGFVRSLLEDKEGNLWVGTYGGGLTRFQDAKFTRFTRAEGLSNNFVLSICEDHKGAVWMGTYDGGLNRLKNGVFKSFTTNDGLPMNTISSVLEDHAGTLWIGTHGGGLVQMRDGKLKKYGTKDGLSNDFILSLYEDRQHNLWVGTTRGLNQRVGEKFKTYKTREGQNFDGVVALFQTSDGSFWIGTSGEGLTKLKDGKFSNYTTREGLSSNFVLSLFEDRDSSLWIGTDGGGLNRLENGKFISCDTKNGLFDDVVFQILSDAKDNFWMSCNKGIFRVSKKQLDDFAEGRRSSITSVVFGKSDGMVSSECNGRHQPSAWRGSDGKLWFPTIKGAVVIDANNYPINQYVPPVVIEETIGLDNTILLGKKIQLPAGSDKFEIYYTALSFTASEKVQFKYKLAGFDKTWINANTRRVAYYTNVPPGTYTFSVIACNNDDVWNEIGSTVELTIEPYFYQTLAFYIICGISVVFITVGGYRLRMRQLRRREQELVTQVQERTKHLSQEIAERMRVEDALRESEQKLRDIIEHSTNLFYAHDTDQKIFYVSPQSRQFLDCEPGEALIHWTEFITDNPINTLGYTLTQKAIETGQRQPMYFLELRTKLGRTLRVEVREAPVVRNGKTVAIVGSLTDVTEHKRAEEALRESEERFRSLFEESKDVVFFGTLEGKIIDVNNAGVELFGYASKEEFFEVDIPRDLFAHPNDWRKHQEILFTQGYVKDFELVLKRKDGSKLNVLETSSVVTDAHGTIVAYRGIIRDVTEQKKLEDQLRQAHKLQSIGILVGGIAHNFNNILGIILGYVSLLRREKENGVRFTEGVEAIQKAVERGAALVRQLLTFARKTDVQLAIVDVNDIIRELARMVMETFPKTIAISLNLKPDLPVVKIDQNQIHQALLNLCVNSRDAMMGEGTLSIATSLVETFQLRERFEGVSGEYYVAIEVVDTGVGMDETTRNHIFEPFFTTKDIGKGTGLGLSVVYGIVKSQNGFIDLQSAQGKGTKFIIYLPAAFGGSTIPFGKNTILYEELSGTETVLVVEDEPSLLDLLKFFLVNKGYTVLSAKDGIEAVDSYHQHWDKIQLVVMDIGLPRLNGWESLKRMREINPEVLVILASGYLTPDIQEDAKKQGIDIFISKPYMSEKVVLAVREALDKAKKN